MILESYKIPDHLNADYMRGYEDGFDAMKHEISRFMEVVTAFKTDTATANVDRMCVHKQDGTYTYTFKDGLVKKDG